VVPKAKEWDVDHSIYVVPKFVQERSYSSLLQAFPLSL